MDSVLKDPLLIITTPCHDIFFNQFYVAFHLHLTGVRDPRAGNNDILYTEQPPRSQRGV